jgi:hypothetical protein
MPEITPAIRELPIYRAGFREGHDTGLATALTALTAEAARQEARAIVSRAPGGHYQARHNYCAHVLDDIARQLGGGFRE